MRLLGGVEPPNMVGHDRASSTAMAALHRAQELGVLFDDSLHGVGGLGMPFQRLSQVSENGCPQNVHEKCESMIARGEAQAAVKLEIGSAKRRDIVDRGELHAIECGSSSLNVVLVAAGRRPFDRAAFKKDTKLDEILEGDSAQT